MTDASEKYVYGIVLAGARTPTVKGLGDRKIGKISREGVAAIVSDVTPPVITGKKELKTHAEVLQRVHENGPVLPMQFGIVMPDEQTVREHLLEPFANELIEQLHAVTGMVELHLRAVYDEETLMTDVVNANGKVLGLSEALRDKPADATYYDRIELGQEVAQTAEGLALEERERILAALGPFAVSTAVNDPKHERVACDAAFLVEAERLGEFDEAVNGIGMANEGRLQFTYSGPHPPYNFVELPLQV